MVEYHLGFVSASCRIHGHDAPSSSMTSGDGDMGSTSSLDPRFVEPFDFFDCLVGRFQSS
jgi:hypothetical protein